MIKVEERETIRRAYYIEKKSIRQIARELHHSRDTVRKAIAAANPEPYTLQKPRRSPVLGPCKARIDELLEENKSLPLATTGRRAACSGRTPARWPTASGTSPAYGETSVGSSGPGPSRLRRSAAPPRRWRQPYPGSTRCLCTALPRRASSCASCADRWGICRITVKGVGSSRVDPC
jgi:hypothetical protein